MSEVQPVDELTFTECMEQLQEGYVGNIAATAGYLLNSCDHDTYGFDSMIIKKKGPDEEETSIYVQLKCTTVIRPDLTRPTFSYVLKKNEYYRRLAVRRKRIKAILLVMVTAGNQREWTVGDHDFLRTQHACYWVSFGRQSGAGRQFTHGSCSDREPVYRRGAEFNFRHH